VEFRDTLLVAAPGDETQRMFTARDWATKTATRNAKCVLAGVDLSPMPALNSWSTAQGRGGGCLVAPDVLIGAWHYSGTLKTGDAQMFVAMDGTVCTRTITATRRIGETDLKACKLDADVDAGVSFAAVLPANYREYLSAPGDYHGYVAGWYSDQNKRIYAGAAWLHNPGRCSYSSYWVGVDGRIVIDSQDPLFKTLVDGDSGSAFWLVIGGKMVLTGVAQTGLPSGPHVAHYIDEIEAAMTAMGSPYKLTTVSLAIFEKP
jgi:hypothetical protein